MKLLGQIQHLDRVAASNVTLGLRLPDHGPDGLHHFRMLGKERRCEPSPDGRLDQRLHPLGLRDPDALVPRGPILGRDPAGGIA